MSGLDGGSIDGADGDVCPKLDDKELCSKLGVPCGAFGVSDPCRGLLSLQCGGCGEGEQCGLYTANTCAKPGDACVPETDTALCSRLGRACGGLTANDNCGSSRVIASCGTCSDGATCSPAGACTCEPETDADLCKAAGSSCGAPKVKDRCGTERTVNCGNCTDGKSCVGDKTCACVPETSAAFCARLGKDCGSVSAPDNCGEARGADCGTCTGDGVCGLYAANVCGQQNCTPESDSALCGRYNKNCGDLTLTNNCGQSRPLSCGTCTGAQTCGATASNVCGCLPETNSTFCTRLGKNCGSVTAQDNCGIDRTAHCGSCGTGDTCGSTVPNVCGCLSESDSTFCARLGKNCDALTGVDNCGLARNASCGSCPSGQACGVASPNVCKCVPESDLSMCARYGKNCGQVTAFDNCSAQRTVASCGTCTSPQTCGTGNVCGCTTETDQAFCARLTKNCGQVTAFDNCGAQRTVASCGTCTSPQTCGAVTVNVCGCVAESDPTFCSRLSKNCGSVTAADNCGTQRTVTSCGTCIGGATCQANVCVGGQTGQPTATPAGGTTYNDLTGDSAVTLASTDVSYDSNGNTTNHGRICYTVDSSVPTCTATGAGVTPSCGNSTTGSTFAYNPVTQRPSINVNFTILKAVACVATKTQSNMTWETYTFQVAPLSVVMPNGASQTGPSITVGTSVQLSTATAGAKLYYSFSLVASQEPSAASCTSLPVNTLNGSAGASPLAQGSVLPVGFTIPSGLTYLKVRFWACKAGYASSTEQIAGPFTVFQ